VYIALHRNLSQSWGASPAIWDHRVLPATRHRWTRMALTPAIQGGTRFTYTGGMEVWVDLGGRYIPGPSILPVYMSTNHLTATRPWIKPTDHKCNTRPYCYCDVWWIMLCVYSKHLWEVFPGCHWLIPGCHQMPLWVCMQCCIPGH